MARGLVQVRLAARLGCQPSGVYAMAEEQLDRFYERLDRIADQRFEDEQRRPARQAPAARAGRHDRRRRRAGPFRPMAMLGGMINAVLQRVVMLALLALGFKAGLIAALGLPGYEQRLGEVTGGRALDPMETRIAALLVPDPLSLRLHESLLVAGVPDGWLAGGTPIRQQREAGLPKRIQIGTGQADVPQLGVGER